MDALSLIQTRARWCEAERIAILCCPEAILGSLADYAEHPSKFAIRVDQLDTVLSPLASDTVTTIVVFTDLADSRRIYNSAAVFQQGMVAGVYTSCIQPSTSRSMTLVLRRQSSR